ncbi:MAG: hypothetical protein QM528_04845 [Phycisphaerales bacterium]|nr:hypothetical protein [Phycisphaerales bacterium]
MKTQFLELGAILHRHELKSETLQKLLGGGTKCGGSYCYSQDGNAHLCWTGLTNVTVINSSGLIYTIPYGCVKLTMDCGGGDSCSANPAPVAQCLGGCSDDSVYDLC